MSFRSRLVVEASKRISARLELEGVVFGGSPCYSIVAIADIHLYGVSTYWQTSSVGTVNQFDRVFCFSVRLSTNARPWEQG